jgi:hypothetical protein
MSKIIFFIFICLNSIILNIKLRSRKTQCVDFGKDCGIFTGICCGNFKCKDFRCQMEGAKDIMKWAPDGDKCNFWHICRKGYECHEHRCLEIAI